MRSARSPRVRLVPTPHVVFSIVLVVACSNEIEGDSGADSGGSTSTTGDSSPATDSASTTQGTTSTTAGPGSGTTTTGNSDESGGGFVMKPDGESGNECNPKAQDCPEGEKCAAWAADGGSSWNANKCVPVTGDGVHGDPCTVEGNGVSGLDDCAEGHMCWDVDPRTNMGACVAFCDVNDTCPPGTTCSVQNDGVLPLCSTSCDPILQDCPAGQGCYAKDGDNGELICIPDASGSGGADGDPCEYDNVCDPGLVCIGGSAGCNSKWCCTPWCDLTKPNTCPGPGEQCVAHFDNPPPGTDHVGVCVIPQ